VHGADAVITLGQIRDFPQLLKLLEACGRGRTQGYACALRYLPVLLEGCPRPGIAGAGNVLTFGLGGNVASNG
jgi:hypothetical protein